MREIIELPGKVRKNIKKRVKELRRQGFTPAVLYGHGLKKSVNLQFETAIISKVLLQTGESSLINLVIDKKKPVTVLVKKTDRDPVTGGLVHLDFYKVNVKQKITAQVPLDFIGKSKAVVDSGGTLVKTINEVEVECLPLVLPPNLKIDISTLKDFEDIVYIKDVKVPKGVEVLADINEVVASVQAPRSEEELDALDEEVAEDVGSVEGVKTEAGEEAEGESEGEDKPTDSDSPVETENKE